MGVFDHGDKVGGADDWSVGAAGGGVIRGVQLEEGHHKHDVGVYDDGTCIQGFWRTKKKIKIIFSNIFLFS